MPFIFAIFVFNAMKDNLHMPVNTWIELLILESIRFIACFLSLLQRLKRDVIRTSYSVPCFCCCSSLKDSRVSWGAIQMSRRHERFPRRRGCVVSFWTRDSVCVSATPESWLDVNIDQWSSEPDLVLSYIGN